MRLASRLTTLGRGASWAGVLAIACAAPAQHVPASRPPDQPLADWDQLCGWPDDPQEGKTVRVRGYVYVALKECPFVWTRRPMNRSCWLGLSSVPVPRQPRPDGWAGNAKFLALVGTSFTCSSGPDETGLHPEQEQEVVGEYHACAIRPRSIRPVRTKAGT